MKIQYFYYYLSLFLHLRNFSQANIEYKQVCLEMDSRMSDINCWRMENGYYTLDTEMNTIKSKVISVAKSTQHYITSNITNNQDSIYIYLHAFNKADSTEGILVLDEILTYIYTSGLHMKLTRLFLVLHGNFSIYESEIPEYATVIKDFIDYGHFFEFTTLSLMQLHSQYMHPDAKILYLHTKGSSKSRYDEITSYWFHSMCIYNIHYYQQNIQLLNNGWETSGILYWYLPISLNIPPHYSGNFFWAKAKKVFQNLDILELNWHYRYGAEYWLLADDNTFWPLYKFESTSKYQSIGNYYSTGCNLSYIHESMSIMKLKHYKTNRTPFIHLYPLLQIPNVKDVKPPCIPDTSSTLYIEKNYHSIEFEL